MFNAEIAAAIQENLAHLNYGEVLAKRTSPPSPSTRAVSSSSTDPTAARSS